MFCTYLTLCLPLFFCSCCDVVLLSPSLFAAGPVLISAGKLWEQLHAPTHLPHTFAFDVDSFAPIFHISLLLKVVLRAKPLKVLPFTGKVQTPTRTSGRSPWQRTSASVISVAAVWATHLICTVSLWKSYYPCAACSGPRQLEVLELFVWPRFAWFHINATF